MALLVPSIQFFFGLPRALFCFELTFLRVRNHQNWVCIRFENIQ